MANNIFDKIPKPAKRALENANITSEEDLAKRSDKELLALHGFGPKALKMIREALKNKIH